MHLKFQRNGVYKLVLFVKRMCLIKGYRIAGKFGGENVWQNNRPTKRLLIVSTNLNHG